MNEVFNVEFIDGNILLPKSDKVSAVFLLAIRDEQILAIYHDRGWDVPGGHVEHGEGIIDALKREAWEEACVRFTDAKPFVLVYSDSIEDKYIGKCMVGFVATNFILKDFVPAPDAEKRAMMDWGEFLKLHPQGRDTMKAIVERAIFLAS